MCGRRGSPSEELGGAVLCDKCRGCFYAVGPHLCMRCSRTVGSEDSLCRFCAERDAGFDKAAAVFDYKDGAKDLIHSLKYSEKPWLVKYAAACMAEKVRSLQWKPDVITYIPMYAKKERHRGFNQAELLAAKIAEELNLQCRSLIVRNRGTIPQSHLSVAERRENIKGAFCVDKLCHEDLAGKCILVVDDVMTTGSSLNEAADVLKDAGAAQIFGISFAAVDDLDRVQGKKQKTEQDI